MCGSILPGWVDNLLKILMTRLHSYYLGVTVWLLQSSSRATVAQYQCMNRAKQGYWMGDCKNLGVYYHQG